jgi:hypothetical protein
MKLVSPVTLLSTLDASGAVSTKPVKVGTALPGTCALGELFFDSDAAAGENLYGATATNTWTLLSGVAAGQRETVLYESFAASVNGTDAAQTLATYTIPADTLQVNDIVRLEGVVQRTAGGGTDANIKCAFGNGGTPDYGTAIEVGAIYLADYRVTGSTAVDVRGIIIRSGSTPILLPIDAGDHLIAITNFDIATETIVALKSSGSYIDVGTTYKVDFRVTRIRP